MDDSGFGRFPDDNLCELLGRRETALRAHRVGERLAFDDRLAAYLPDRIDRVLNDILSYKIAGK